MRSAPTRRLRSRAGLALASLFAALVSLIVLPGTAWAACGRYTCDGHDPNVQTWQSGPFTASGPYDFGGGFSIELRKGTTDGDPYAWARARFPGGSNENEYTMYVERCHLDHTVCEILGQRQAGGSWTTDSTPNYYLTRSAMYYDPNDRTIRACLYHGDWSSRTCTGWA
ncbi:hypothetical protein AB0451_35480 [Streptomyces sp. NPDC052000]|uniref:hypothetical protein n=1 Tax=Streptomyces sp. NPDC052000 TaxID=3155676 RepID=UPI0034507057